MDLLDRCLARPGKNYPAGYGFALAYLDDHLNPAVLRDAACACVGWAFGPYGDADARKSDDLAAFVLNYGEAECAEDYMIEAAQLLLEYGLRGNRDAMNALATCGHPGYDYVTPSQDDRREIAAHAIGVAAGKCAEFGDHDGARMLRSMADSFPYGK